MVTGSDKSIGRALRASFALRLLLALCLLWPTGSAFAQALAAIPAMQSPVVDTTGTLDDGARAALDAQARALQQRKGSQLQILMVASTQPEDIDSYAVRAFDQFQLGRKGVSDGVLLVVAKDDRRVRIEVGYGLEGAITDAQAGRIIQEYITPKFREGDYAGGLTDATAMLTKLIDGEPLPAPLAGEEPIAGQAVASGMTGLILVMIVASFANGILNIFIRRLPALIRGVVSGLVSAFVVWQLSPSLWLAVVAGVVGLVFGLIGGGSGMFVVGGGSGGYSGGGGWGGGGGSSGGGGGGWSGGGGSSGGGGASGSW